MPQAGMPFFFGGCEPDRAAWGPQAPGGGGGDGGGGGGRQFRGWPQPEGT
jgi:hypothetical protein